MIEGNVIFAIIGEEEIATLKKNGINIENQEDLQNWFNKSSVEVKIEPLTKEDYLKMVKL